MKTAEELKSLKEEVETVNKKLAELSKDELKAVIGGVNSLCGDCPHSRHCDTTPSECHRYLLQK